MSGRSERFHEIWSSYRKNRIGLIGLLILFFFLLIAILAPVLTPYDPITDRFLAEGIALPSWYQLMPAYRALPHTMDFEVAPKIDAPNWQVKLDGPLDVSDNGLMILNLKISHLNSEVVFAEFTHTFDYNFDPPLSFQITTDFQFIDIKNIVYQFESYITNPDSETFLIWDSGPNVKPLEPSGLKLDSKGLPFEYKSKMGLEWHQNVAEKIFSRKGIYRITFKLHLKADDHTDPSYFKVTFSRLILHIPGRIHGLLGTDHLGSDLMSQLLYGTRISLLIGVSAALLSVSIGLVVGLVSGYQGGITDEALMRLVDVLLVLPGLPLLMILSGLFGRNIWITVFLLGILSWSGFARVVRAQVLQLKTATFVEASKALGSSSWHTITKHLLPNVLTLAYATVALYIPGAIITEAALSFLALGDPNTPSWGRIFYSANAFGAFQHLAWWWIIPPGVAITMLSLSFVFIGTTLDDILNPRIKARK